MVKKGNSETINHQRDDGYIVPEMRSFVAGRKGRNVKRLEKIYGIKIILLSKGGSPITIEGPAKLIVAAKKGIEQNLSSKTSSVFFIKKDYVCLVIGRKG